MDNITILKIGGSILTNKNADSEKPEVQESVAHALASELSEYLDSHKESFILVHGAGSFGHPLAAKYGLNDAGIKEKDACGVGATHNSMQYLNWRIADIFLQEGCPAFGMSPASLVVKKRNEVGVFFHDSISWLLERGLVPVLHGDVVANEDTQFSICSGDQIVSYLSTKVFLPKRVLFATDVEGICTHDPKVRPDAKAIKEMRRDELKEMSSRTKDASKDTTGSMGGKVSEILSMSCDACVFNGAVKGNLSRVLSGEAVGTRISG